MGVETTNVTSAVAATYTRETKTRESFSRELDLNVYHVIKKLFLSSYSSYWFYNFTNLFLYINKILSFYFIINKMMSPHNCIIAHKHSKEF